MRLSKALPFSSVNLPAIRLTIAISVVLLFACAGSSELPIATSTNPSDRADNPTLLATTPAIIPTRELIQETTPLPEPLRASLVEDAESAYLLGSAHFDEGRFDKAIEAFTEAIDLHSENSLYFEDRGWAYANLNQLKEASNDFDQSIRLDPQNADAYRGRGTVLGFLGQTDQALGYLTDAIRLNPIDSVSYVVRGSIYADLGQTERALSDFDEAIVITPEEKDNYVIRSMAQRVLGNYSAAEQDLRRGAELGADAIEIELQLQDIKELIAVRMWGLVDEFRARYRATVFNANSYNEDWLLLDSDKFTATYLLEACILTQSPTLAGFGDFIDQTLQRQTQDGVPEITMRVKSAIAGVMVLSESSTPFTGCMAPYVEPKTSNEAVLAVSMMQPVYTKFNPLSRESIMRVWERAASMYYFEWTDISINDRAPFLLWLVGRSDLSPIQ